MGVFGRKRLPAFHLHGEGGVEMVALGPGDEVAQCTESIVERRRRLQSKDRRESRKRKESFDRV